MQIFTAMDKSLKFNEIKSYLDQMDLRVVGMDDARPWGGFFVIDENDSAKFINLFFPVLDQSALSGGKISPKILMVQPGKKLSWQYHHRRSEVWKLIDGEAAVAKSETDVEAERIQLHKGDIVELKQGERHRLIGLGDWGVVAEIWVHTDHSNPSNEEDIVRLQDDFGR